LLAGVVAACLVPNNYCVAALISKMFIKGLALKLKGIDASCPTKADASETQLCNLLASLPSKSAETDAFRLKRLLWAAQHARAELRVQVDLHCAFRVKCQLKVWCFEETSGKWVQSYCVCANGLLLIYAQQGRVPSHVPIRVAEFGERCITARAGAPERQDVPPDCMLFEGGSVSERKGCLGRTASRQIGSRETTSSLMAGETASRRLRDGPEDGPSRRLRDETASKRSDRRRSVSTAFSNVF
jgi:hypothetical protein